MEVTSEIKATVLKETEQSLLDIGKEMGLNIGEVIDRLALEITCNDPETAAILVLNYFYIAVREQKEEQIAETMERVVSSLLQFLRIMEISTEELIEKIPQYQLEYTQTMKKELEETISEVNKIKEQVKSE